MFHASTRFFLRRIVAAPKLSSSYALLPTVTRGFHFSRVVLAASGEVHETGETKKIIPMKLSTRVRKVTKSVDKETKKRVVKPKEVKERAVKPKEAKNKAVKPGKSKKEAKCACLVQIHHFFVVRWMAYYPANNF